ncbi:MAG: hypothetical protein WC460_05735 [Patescibacteria group bacterium]
MTNEERREFKKKYKSQPYTPPPIKKRHITQTTFTKQIGINKETARELKEIQAKAKKKKGKTSFAKDLKKAFKVAEKVQKRLKEISRVDEDRLRTRMTI